MKETTTFGYHKYEFDEYGIKVEVTRFRPERGDLHAYFNITADPIQYPGMEYPHVMLQKQNLSSGNAKSTLVNNLQDRISLGKEIWAGVVETVCTRSLRTHWKGSDVVKIGKNPRRTEVPYLLYPVIRKDAPCIIYGTGGIGKSYVSLYFALLVQHNLSVGRLAPRQANVLYLDWESGEEDLNDRLVALNKGLGIEGELNYRRCYDDLKDDVDELAKWISQDNIDLVIVDAKGAAIGGQINEAKETIQMFNALRSLNVTSVIVDHVSKEANSGPIGSVYNLNEARNVWEMRASQEEGSDTSRIGLYHRKTNVGKRHKAFGLEFKFLDDGYDNIDTVWVSEVDVGEDSETRAGLTMQDQIEAILRDSIEQHMDGSYEYTAMSIEEIRQHVKARGNTPNTNTVSTRLSDKKYNNIRWRHEGVGKYIYIPEHSRPDAYNGTGVIKEEVKPTW